MTKPSFAGQKEAWASPPLDDIGYIPSRDLLAMDDGEFMTLMVLASSNRYNGWRNDEGLWRETLGLDTTTGKVVLDYGSGAGFEALEYARLGNEVWLADIVPDNLKVAERLFKLSGNEPAGLIEIKGRRPFASPPPLDVIHCSGVLHHIPNADAVVEQMAKWLKDDGELRLMVYSDRTWQVVIGGDPPEDVLLDGDGLEFARAMDAVGDYADWYSPDRLEERFGKWFPVAVCAYLPSHLGYLVARLRKS